MRFGALRYPLGAFVLSRALVFGVVAVAGWVNRPHGADPSWWVFFGRLGDWDGVWYQAIAAHGYDASLFHGNLAAFSPLYPLCLAGLAWVFPNADPVLLAVLISNVCFAAALCVIHALALPRLGEDAARRATLYLALAPLAFAFSAVYAESLFLLLAAVSFALAGRGRWWTASIAGALCTLARPVGIALFPALLWRAWVEGGGAWGRAFLRRALPLLLLPATQLGWAGYLWWRTGDALAAPHAQERGWARGAAFPPLLIWDTVQDEILDQHLLRFAVHIGFVLLWVALLWVLWLRREQIGLEYGIFALVALALPFAAGSLVSAGRFGLAAFPLIWALGLLGGREWIDTTVRAVFPALLAVLVLLAYGTGTFSP